MSEKRPSMVAVAPIETRLAKIGEKIGEHVVWDGEDSPAVRTARWIVAEVEDALREGAELWQPTAATEALTGFDSQTLLKWARRKLAGEKLPREWRSMEVRKLSSGYLFRVSTLPVKSRAA